MDRVEIDGWLGRVVGALSRCECKTAAPADLVREVHDLLASGPAHVCAAIRPEMSRSTLRLLLDAGAIESAAIRLLEKCGYMLSSNGEGHVIASVLLPTAERDYSYNASSEAAALCGAMLVSLQERLAND